MKGLDHPENRESNSLDLASPRNRESRVPAWIPRLLRPARRWARVGLVNPGPAGAVSERRGARENADRFGLRGLLGLDPDGGKKLMAHGAHRYPWNEGPVGLHVDQLKVSGSFRNQVFGRSDHSFYSL